VRRLSRLRPGSAALHRCPRPLRPWWSQRVGPHAGPSVRQLKSNPSTVLRAAEADAMVLVTSHQQPAALVVALDRLACRTPLLCVPGSPCRCLRLVPSRWGVAATVPAGHDRGRGGGRTGLLRPGGSGSPRPGVGDEIAEALAAETWWPVSPAAAAAGDQPAPPGDSRPAHPASRSRPADPP